MTVGLYLAVILGAAVETDGQLQADCQPPYTYLTQQLITADLSAGIETAGVEWNRLH